MPRKVNGKWFRFHCFSWAGSKKRNLRYKPPEWNYIFWSMPIIFKPINTKNIFPNLKLLVIEKIAITKRIVFKTQNSLTYEPIKEYLPDFPLQMRVWCKKRREGPLIEGKINSRSPDISGKFNQTLWALHEVSKTRSVF